MLLTVNGGWAWLHATHGATGHLEALSGLRRHPQLYLQMFSPWKRWFSIAMIVYWRVSNHRKTSLNIFEAHILKMVYIKSAWSLRWWQLDKHPKHSQQSHHQKVNMVTLKPPSGNDFKQSVELYSSVVYRLVGATQLALLQAPIVRRVRFSSSMVPGNHHDWAQ